MSDLTEYAKSAKKASQVLATLSTSVKNKALENIAAALLSSSEEIFKANEEDVARSEDENLDKPLLKRLTLRKTRNWTCPRTSTTSYSRPCPCKGSIPKANATARLQSTLLLSNKI